jgi:hypothetical protein
VVDVDMLAAGVPSLDDWADVTRHPFKALDLHDNFATLLKPKVAAATNNDLISLYSPSRKQRGGFS